MEQLRELLINALDWWDEHQFDTQNGDYNVYDVEPDFVVSAKKMWSDNFGTENPNNWMWLN